VERRFNDQLREHEDNEYAHSAMRHTWINETLAPKWLQIELDRQMLERRLVVMEEAQRKAALAAAEAIGEARANRQLLRFFGTAISLLVTVFGVAILVKLGVI
jgi:hypothetical protein